MLKYFLPVLLLLIVPCLVSATPGGTATQTVTFQVDPILQIDVSGNPGALLVNSAVAGSDPTEDTDASTTYCFTTNCYADITGEIDEAMPTGIALKLRLQAPGDSSGQGDVSLTTTAQDLVTGIEPSVGNDLTITYTLDPLASGGTVASSTRTVTLTILEGAV